MSTSIFNARIKFAPKVGTASNGNEYVLLNVSKKAGKDSDGNAVYNEYHLVVWGRYDVELAKALNVGDRICFGIEKERVSYRTDQKTGKVYPFISGDVATGELAAVYTNSPSQGLFAYAQAQAQAYAARKAANQAPSELIQQAPVPQVTPAVPQAAPAMAPAPQAAPQMVAPTPAPMVAPAASVQMTAPAPQVAPLPTQPQAMSAGFTVPF